MRDVSDSGPGRGKKSESHAGGGKSAAAQGAKGWDFAGACEAGLSDLCEGRYNNSSACSRSLKVKSCGESLGCIGFSSASITIKSDKITVFFISEGNGGFGVRVAGSSIEVPGGGYS